MTPGRACTIAVLTGLLAPAPGGAQQRPLRVQDPVPIATGHVLVEAGVEWLAGRSFPLSGLAGDLARLPAVGFSFGFGRAEFQLDGGFQVMRIDHRDPAAPFADELEVDGDVTSDIVDPVVATKILLRHEGHFEPAVGLRVATKIPSAANEKGLGTDAMDFSAALLAGKRLAGTRVAANFGMGVLSVPEDGDRQNDVLVWGISVAGRVGGRLEVVAEALGREDLKGDTAAGTEDLGQARLGVRWDAGPARVDAAVIAGLEDPEAEWGLTLGATVEIPAFVNER